MARLRADPAPTGVGISPRMHTSSLTQKFLGDVVGQSPTEVRGLQN